MLAPLVAEGAGETTAAGVRIVGLDADPGEKLGVVLDADQRPLMAVRVHGARRPSGVGSNDGACSSRSCERSMLWSRSRRVLVVGEELAQLVLEDGEAARLEDDHRQTGPEVGAERVEHLSQVAPCAVEHAKVVERAAAAQAARRNANPARRLEHLHCRLPGRRMEGVRERVRPQDDRCAAVVRRPASPHPLDERRRREARQVALGARPAARLSTAASGGV